MRCGAVEGRRAIHSPEGQTPVKPCAADKEGVRGGTTGSPALMAAAGAAAAAGRVGLGALVALFHLEGMAAAARRDGVGVLDLEAGLLESVQKVDRGATQVRGAGRVDDHCHAFELELDVAGCRARV